MITRLILAAFLVAPALAPQPAPPYLFLRLITPKGTSTSAPGQLVEVANHDRIQLEVCIRARTVADRFEQPEIQALNQHPDYFRNRPPANITLTVQRLVDGRKEPMPFRINSSGGGKNLAVHYVNADIDMLEDRGARLAKAALLVDWMATQIPSDQRSRLLQAAPEKLAAYFEEQYINNPPGEYEITARYTPTTPDNWRGALASSPLRIRVLDEGDFFEVLKTKMAAKPGAAR
jgi:hypothetical protein